VSSFKVPKRVLFFDDGELPSTGSDKVQHAELRRIAVERLAHESTETTAV
jgi:acyl-coenzyme A synthetase/AMP-(fatty) acid ligase